jgi:hypothetical protein
VEILFFIAVALAKGIKKRLERKAGIALIENA